MKQKNVALVVTTFLPMGCRDVRDTELSELTDKQRASLDKKLNGEEERLLIGYMMRQGMSPAFGGKGAPAGITVRQAINEQRNFLEKEEQAEAEEAKKWIDAGRKAKQGEFAQLLSESLVDKWTPFTNRTREFVCSPPGVDTISPTPRSLALLAPDITGSVDGVAAEPSS